VRSYLVHFLLLQSGKKALHPRVVETMTDTAEALPVAVSRQQLTELGAGILAASVRMQDSAPQIQTVHNR